jgi:hypothetical protein
LEFIKRTSISSMDQIQDPIGVHIHDRNSWLFVFVWDKNSTLVLDYLGFGFLFFCLCSPRIISMSLCFFFSLDFILFLEWFRLETLLVISFSVYIFSEDKFWIVIYCFFNLDMFFLLLLLYFKDFKYYVSCIMFEDFKEI